MLSKSSKKIKYENKQEFGYTNPSQQKHGKGGPNSQHKGQSKDNQPQENLSKPQAKKGNGKMKKDIGKWCEFHKIS